ncbi:MBL fold metallo-hydrolase [Clostridia bacterium]|nr:MBL fold metallo-hydrolase [Clostridia bacterium]
MRLLPSVFQVGGPALTHSNDATAYLLTVGDALYLIECGTPEGYELLQRNIRKLGFDPARVKRIYGTHGHYDHVGAAARFAEDYYTELYLHEADREQVESGDDVRTTASLLYGHTFPPAKVHHPLTGGMSFTVDAGVVETLHTPGHSMGSCCFVLTHICGMVLLFGGDTLSGGFSPRIGSDEDVWRNSLNKLCERNYDCYTMGHTPPILLCDANARLDSLRRSFANYYTPWFKNFYEDYRY